MPDAELAHAPDSSEQAKNSVRIVTLGCRLNAYESEAMRTLAAEGGARNAVIVNTCAVTNEAVRQARQAIRRARRENPDASVVVTGRELARLAAGRPDDRNARAGERHSIRPRNGWAFDRRT